MKKISTQSAANVANRSTLAAVSLESLTAKINPAPKIAPVPTTTRIAIQATAVRTKRSP